MWKATDLQTNRLGVTETLYSLVYSATSTDRLGYGDLAVHIGQIFPQLWDSTTELADIFRTEIMQHIASISLPIPASVQHIG